MVVFDELDSTMDELHRQAEAGAPSGAAVLARRQQGARGRLGRAWSSEEGGLWLSVLARDVDPSALDVLSPRVGLAVVTALETAIPTLPRLRLKWPNDLIVAGRKLGGILVEARWQRAQCEWVVIGVGVNVTNRPPAHLAEVAIAIADLTTPPPLATIAPLVIEAVERTVAGGPVLDSAELLEWHARDELYGHQLSRPVVGIAAGITARGALRVRRADGQCHELRTGEVAANGGPGRD